MTYETCEHGCLKRSCNACNARAEHTGHIDDLRELSECPPTCTLEQWVKILLQVYKRTQHIEGPK